MSEENHNCDPETERWDADANKCVPKETEKGLTQRIEGVIKDYFVQLESKLDKLVDAKIQSIVQAKEAQVELQLRKSLGLESDPALHASDIPKIVRKMQLAAAPAGKTTPASPGESGPDGNAALLKAAGKTETVRQLDAVKARYGWTEEAN
jgi:hypothetical protein